MTSKYVIYCDKADDEELAKIVFASGQLSSAEVVRLPPRSAAPACLQPYLEWERADWLITRDDVLVAATEISKHGYTGDNGFQRFARLQRAAMLGVPFVYFTPFSRTRLNEVDEGQHNPRNVAPEMFGALLEASDEYGIPCLAVRWPTDHGVPVPLGEPDAQPALRTLRTLMEGFATLPRTGTESDWDWLPNDVLEAMRLQAGIPYRGSVTRQVFELPADIEDDRWLLELLPDSYFKIGKADKVLAYAALRSTHRRALPPGVRWNRRGRARLLYLGYQWRPDPSCGLIAFSGVLARREDIPLVVVWPRVFVADGPQRRQLVRGLSDLVGSGQGVLAERARELDYPTNAMSRFRKRVSTDPGQFGVFTPSSKVGRILEYNAALCVFGDALYIPGE